MLDEKFAKWKGVDREKINWNPKVDEKKCVGCGMCVTSCGRNVYDFDFNKNKAIVARPKQCMVGCMSCETWCIHNAISFPDKKVVKEIIIKEELIKKSKKKLDEMKN